MLNLVPFDNLRPSVRDYLYANYKILDEFTFYGFDQNPKNFLSWCQKWQNYVFSDHERILILNVDCDYYPSLDSIGNNNFNFFACCAHFQLPTEYLLYISPQHGIHEEVHKVCSLFNLSTPEVINTICFPIVVPSNVSPVGYNSQLIQKSYVCLNNNIRNHRLLFLSLLTHKNLLEKGYVSYHFPKAVKDSFSMDNINENNNCPITLRTTLPFCRQNDIFEFSISQREIYNTYHNILLASTQQIDDDDLSPTNVNIIQKGFVYVVTETVFDYPYPWISEKIIKGFLAKRPMIIVGAANTLARLKSLGWKTFDDLWDESYDKIQSAKKRMDAIVDLVELVTKMNLTQLKTLIQRAEEIVEFNYQHTVNNFVKKDQFEIY